MSSIGAKKLTRSGIRSTVKLVLSTLVTQQSLHSVVAQRTTVFVTD